MRYHIWLLIIMLSGVLSFPLYVAAESSSLNNLREHKNVRQSGVEQIAGHKQFIDAPNSTQHASELLQFQSRMRVVKALKQEINAETVDLEQLNQAFFERALSFYIYNDKSFHYLQLYWLEVLFVLGYYDLLSLILPKVQRASKFIEPNDRWRIYFWSAKLNLVLQKYQEARKYFDMALSTDIEPGYHSLIYYYLLRSAKQFEIEPTELQDLRQKLNSRANGFYQAILAVSDFGLPGTPEKQLMAIKHMQNNADKRLLAIESDYALLNYALENTSLIDKQELVSVFSSSGYFNRWRANFLIANIYAKRLDFIKAYSSLEKSILALDKYANQSVSLLTKYNRINIFLKQEALKSDFAKMEVLMSQVELGYKNSQHFADYLYYLVSLLAVIVVVSILLKLLQVNKNLKQCREYDSDIDVLSRQALFKRGEKLITRCQRKNSEALLLLFGINEPVWHHDFYPRQKPSSSVCNLVNILEQRFTNIALFGRVDSFSLGLLVVGCTSSEIIDLTKETMRFIELKKLGPVNVGVADNSGPNINFEKMMLIAEAALKHSVERGANKVTLSEHENSLVPES